VCLNPETTSHVTVSIARYFNEEERKLEPDLLGIQGDAGWFVSSRSMVTVAHVAEAMHLSSEDWKDIEIRDRESRRSVAVRLLQLAGTQSEKIAVLELKTPISAAQFLRFRMEPLAAWLSISARRHNGGKDPDRCHSVARRTPLIGRRARQQFGSNQMGRTLPAWAHAQAR
jgi:hypothetical protein